MNRPELQQLAADRIEDAKILLDNGRWSAAYYLAGYAVETALKACILRFVEETGVIFTDKKFAERCWTHKIDELVRQADLEQSRGLEIQNNPIRKRFWDVIEEWSELSRYKQTLEPAATELYEAVTNDPDGVLPWIQLHW